MADDYKRAVGQRLRAVRHMQGLTLAEVEERSDGRWKAVVIGSYERGDRGVSVARLSEIAAFYGVPVSHLLPTEQSPATEHAGATVDLAVLAELGEEHTTLRRFVDRIVEERGDYNGRLLTLRAEDVRAISTAHGDEPAAFLDRLREEGLVVDEGDGVTPGPPPARAL